MIDLPCMKIITFLSALLFVSLSLSGQTAKKPLKTDDFQNWKVIENQQISPDGQTVAYELNPQQGDGLLLLQHPGSTKADTVKRGTSAVFSPDSKYLICRIKVPFEEQKSAIRKKLKKEQMPLDSIGIRSLETGKTNRFAKLISFGLPEENSAWLAFLVRPDSLIKTKEDLKLFNLILYHLPTGDTVIKRQVSDYHYAKKGGKLIYSIYSEDSLKRHSQVCLFDTKTGLSATIFSDRGLVKEAATDEQGEQFAFLFSPDTTKHKAYSLYYCSGRNPLAKMLLNDKTTGMPAGWSPSEHADIRFSKSGSRIILGTARTPQPEAKDSLAEGEKAVLDVWSWTDAEIMPQQKVNLENEKKRSYLALYDVHQKKFLQLADTVIAEVNLSMDGDGLIALGKNKNPYIRAGSWTGRAAADYYAVNTKTGESHLLVSNQTSGWLSPEGDWFVWFSPADSAYHARAATKPAASGYTLTHKMPVSFYDELRDIPMEVNSYGIAGWSEKNHAVYLYDRYDIWKADLSGKLQPVSITQGYGRNRHMSFRYVRLDPDEKYIPEGNILLKAFNEKTKAAGYFSVNPEKEQAPDSLIVDDCQFSFIKKAKDNARMIWTKENIQEYPDIWVSGPDFDQPRRLSDANPQRKEYNWVRTELVHWTAFSGQEMEGILYLPEDFDPGKKYPMIVYFYERNADQIHRHMTPAPSRSVINPCYYASNSYLVFVPDIVYQTGNPGESSFNCIISGVNYLLHDRNYIRKDRVGIQGQSWGGYQTAYLITKTNMFAAAMAGAPVSNMTSAYGGIRWETGISRMSQYEHAQSRIGGTLWEKPMDYLKNSPLFAANQIKTPLLIMHNDKDGAVPWYQGIELFMALRRLDKPVWMLNYNNEPHNLNKESWANRMDLTCRTHQFFDHYLKDQPMPHWMKYGLPALQKGKDPGYTPAPL